MVSEGLQLEVGDAKKCAIFWGDTLYYCATPPWYNAVMLYCSAVLSMSRSALYWILTLNCRSAQTSVERGGRGERGESLSLWVRQQSEQTVTAPSVTQLSGSARIRSGGIVQTDMMSIYIMILSYMLYHKAPAKASKSDIKHYWHYGGNILLKSKVYKIAVLLTWLNSLHFDSNYQWSVWRDWLADISKK